ncbi:RNA-directed DNA polymerase [Croceicoccus mobilis]|nr:RNA-directed DNA polymerase [Croceicoccus mobilis]
MRDAVDREQPIIAMTLDVGSFYHNIDPSFFVHPEFLEDLGVELSAFELSFSQVISSALSAWSALCCEQLKILDCPLDENHQGGIPIGLSVVRVISNVLLTFLDRQVEQQLGPVYYARYVDDLFLVLHDSKEIRSTHDLWKFIVRRIPAFKRTADGNVILDLPKWGGATTITLQAAKQKTFFLSGRSGADLLDHIAAQIREVSSERRTMPLPEQIERSEAARALAASEASDDADSLRRADGLTLRRLGWSVLLRAVNTLARDLRPEEWKSQREDFYEFAHEHVIRPDKVLEQIDHLPRLLSFAVSLGDWASARRVYQETISAIFKLQEATGSATMRINGIKANSVPAKVWKDTRSQVQRFFREALIRAFPISTGPIRQRALIGLLKDLELDAKELVDLALKAREADWARTPYREHLRTDAIGQPPEKSSDAILADRYPYSDLLRQFLARTEKTVEGTAPRRVASVAITSADDRSQNSILPFLFPTRPYTPEEIALYLPEECVFAEPTTAAHAWADYTRAVRGVWVRSNLADELEPLEKGDNGEGLPVAPFESSDNVKPPPIVLKRSAPLRPVRLGLTSFEVTDECWEKGAADAPDLSLSRYRQLARIVNTAIGAFPKPDYLLLPELSVPECWINTIAGRLRSNGISLIAGLDYTHHSNKRVDSSAVLVLSDDRLGYPSSVQIRQRKTLPAPHEEELLYTSHGLQWAEGADNKRVYQHNDLHFGILVCSELLNMGYRANFQGQVDCLITLSWNKDLESFSALIDAAALDVHAYMALVNNRRFGDSRLRRPAKLSRERDVCRVRGGLNDQLVVVEINPKKLRRQQSRDKRWPRSTDAYKPAPEGYNISETRKCIPD